jgi:hypothetical protein
VIGLVGDTDEVETRWRRRRVPPMLRTRRYTMEAVEAYTSTVAVLSTALLLVVAGLVKRQLVWKPKRVPARRRRQSSR